jgi:hypothetical protein
MAGLVLAAALYLALASFVFGARRSDYSHVRDTLSELGAQGAPAQRAVSWGVFFPVGLAVFIAGFPTWARAFAASGLALSLALGYLGGALFPCDPGAQLPGSRRQALHSLAGAIEYGGGMGALIVLAESRESSLYLGAAALVAAALAGLTLRAFRPVRGLLQRVGEMALFGALACALSD